MGLTGEALLQSVDNLLTVYRDYAAAAHQSGNREVAQQIAIRYKALKALREKVEQDPSVDIEPSRLPPANPMDLFGGSMTRSISIARPLLDSVNSVRSMVRLQEAIMLENRRDPYNHMTMKELRKNTREALRDMGTTIRDIQRLVAATDYNEVPNQASPEPRSSSPTSSIFLCLVLAPSPLVPSPA